MKVITPPLATAATKASEVQLAGEPVPTTRALAMLSARAAVGTVQLPSGLPVPGAAAYALPARANAASERREAPLPEGIVFGCRIIAATVPSAITSFKIGAT